MKTLSSYFRLIRFPNILMVVLTMYLMRWAVIKPLLESNGFQLRLGEGAFILLVLATVFITAAGYVINDYHDVRADRINKPDDVVVDYFITRRTAMGLHLVLNSVGAVMGIAASLFFNVPWLIPIFVFTPFFLWGYSVRLKHKAILGNLIVAVLTGMVPLMVVLFEYPLLSRYYKAFIDEFPHGFWILLFWVGTFAFFAFITTLIREILKDAEDLEGDRVVGSRTLPLLRGQVWTRRIVIALALATLGVLIYIFLSYLFDWISLVYFTLFLATPIILLIWKTHRARSKDDYHSLSRLTKVIMLFGLLYAPLAHFLIKLYF